MLAKISKTRAISAFLFFVTSALAQAGDGSIVLVDSGQNLGNGRTFSMALGDLDGDEDLDLFVTNYIEANKVWINDGNGLFTDSGQNLGAISGHGVDLGDLDGDGDLDAFVVFNSSADQVYFNDGSGMFSNAGQNLGAPDDYGLNVSLGDIDGDNDLDALVALYEHPNRVWINDGNGSFSDLGQRIGGTESGGMQLEDLDADEDLDIFLKNSSAPDAVLLNNGAGVFVDSGQSVGPNEGRGNAAVADLDGDGDLDVFVTNFDQGSRVFLNDGTGSFMDSGQSFGQRGQKICLVDLDGDGDLDGITTHMQDGNPIWLNDGTGLFSSSNLTVGGLNVLSIGAGDVDGDAASDLVLGKLEENGGNQLYFNETDFTSSGSGYLWLSGYDWSGNPTPIYRYNVTTNEVDLTVETGIQDQMVNNLAVDSSHLYIGAGHGQEFWKADFLTGQVSEQGVYSPAISGIHMDGAFRASNGHLYRADSFGKLLAADTDGQVASVHEVTNGNGLVGLEFVGDQLYGTCDGGFGSIDSEPDWTFHAIPLSGLGTGVGWFYGGLAHDPEAGILYLVVYRNDVASLYRVEPDLGSATLVSNLPAEAGFPLGAWPQAMGWVSGNPTSLEKKSWGDFKSLYR